jgi:hypothetical protein
MPDTLYDTDALAWSEAQAALLRRFAGGKPPQQRRLRLRPRRHVTVIKVVRHPRLPSQGRPSR